MESGDNVYVIMDVSMVDDDGNNIGAFQGPCYFIRTNNEWSERDAQEFAVGRVFEIEL
jgi:hypothetical protein